MRKRVVLGKVVVVVVIEHRRQRGRRSIQLARVGVDIACEGLRETFLLVADHLVVDVGFFWC